MRDLPGVDYDGAPEPKNSYPLRLANARLDMRNWDAHVMRKLYAIGLICFLTSTGRAADLATSFEQAAALGDAQEKKPAALAYKPELMTYYQQRYSPVFQSCLKSTQNRDTSPFSFVAAIGKGGQVLRLYVDHETKIYACVRETLQKDKFPPPPFSPYYMHVSMSFQ